MALLSVSSWALNRHLGPLHWTKWDPRAHTPVTMVEDRPRTLPLTNLPARLAAMGLQACELGHFHLPALETIRNDDAAEIRQAFERAGVVLWSLLVDYGDISAADPQRRDADRAYIAGWVRLAARLGARHVRVVAGEGSPYDEAAIDRAVAALDELATLGRSLDVGILTENFRRLASTPEVCTQICMRLQGRVELTADFGNFPKATRAAALAQILPFARSVHAKPDLDAQGNLDTDGFDALLDLVADTHFSGAYTVVYEGPQDQWVGIQSTAERIRRHGRALSSD